MIGNGYSRFFSTATRILLVLLLLSSILLHVGLVLRLDFDGRNTGDEGEMLYGLRNARLGRPLYLDYHTPPHVLTQYMPLHYYVPGLLARLMGAGEMRTFVVGRCYVYALWVGVGLCIYALARQAGCTRQFACVASLLWFAGEMAPEMAVSFRPDAAALFLSLAALWVYQKGRGLAHATGAVALLLAAFFHKQSAVVALAVIVVEECHRKEYGRGFMMLGGWIAGVVLGLLGARWLAGEAFIQNTFGSLAVTVGLSHQVYVLVMSAARGLVALAGGGLACATLAGGAYPRILKKYFLGALVLAFLSSAKFGSGPNYYLESYALGCVLSGLLLRHWKPEIASRVTILVSVGWLGLAYAAVWLGLQPRLESLAQLSREVVNHSTMRASEARAWDVVLKRLGELEEPVLIENSYVALRLGRIPYMMNASFFGELQSRGKFEDTELLRRLDAGEFMAVVTACPLRTQAGFRHLSPRWIEAIGRRYEPAEFLGSKSPEARSYIYRPVGIARVADEMDKLEEVR